MATDITTAEARRTRAKATETARDAREAAARAERAVLAVVREGAYATVGAGDSALGLVRTLPAKADELRTAAPRAVREWATATPRELSAWLRAAGSQAERQFEALASRGREVVDGVAGSRVTRHAAEQADTARAQVKAAATSTAKAADAGADAVEAAAAKAGRTRYEDRTVEELRDRAAEVGIAGRSQMNKEELIEALRRR